MSKPYRMTSARRVALRKAQRASAIKRHQKARRNKRIAIGVGVLAGAGIGVGGGVVLGKRMSGGKGPAATHAPAPAVKNLATPMPGASAPNVETAQQVKERIMSEAKISGGPHQMPKGWNKNRQRNKKRSATIKPRGKIPGMVYRLHQVDPVDPQTLREAADPRDPTRSYKDVLDGSAKGRRGQHRGAPKGSEPPTFMLNDPNFGMPKSMTGDKVEPLTNREIAQAVNRQARAQRRMGLTVTREQKQFQQRQMRESHGTPRKPRTGKITRAKKKK